MPPSPPHTPHPDRPWPVRHVLLRPEGGGGLGEWATAAAVRGTAVLAAGWMRVDSPGPCAAAGRAPRELRAGHISADYHPSEPHALASAARAWPDESGSPPPHAHPHSSPYPNQTRARRRLMTRMYHVRSRHGGVPPISHRSVMQHLSRCAIAGPHPARLTRFPASPDSLPSTNFCLRLFQPSHLPLLLRPDRAARATAGQR